MITNKKKQISIIIPREIAELLQEEANAEGRTRSQQVAKILQDYYKRKLEKTDVI